MIRQNVTPIMYYKTIACAVVLETGMIHPVDGDVFFLEMGMLRPVDGDDTSWKWG